jgi:hypothetical protein
MQTAPPLPRFLRVLTLQLGLAAGGGHGDCAYPGT